MLVTFKLRVPLEAPLGAKVKSTMSPLGEPDTPKVLKFILLYTLADGAPDNITFIDAFTSTGFPDVIRFKEPVTPSPPTKSPMTDSTNGLWATNPLIEGSKPEASIYKSPCGLA